VEGQGEEKNKQKKREKETDDGGVSQRLDETGPR